MFASSSCQGRYTFRQVVTQKARKSERTTTLSRLKTVVVDVATNYAGIAVPDRPLRPCPDGEMVWQPAMRPMTPQFPPNHCQRQSFCLGGTSGQFRQFRFCLPNGSPLRQAEWRKKADSVQSSYGTCCNDRADVFDLPDFAAVRFEVASVDGRAAAVAARDVESADSPVSSSSIHALA